jgi:ATP-dependent Zn protease
VSHLETHPALARLPHQIAREILKLNRNLLDQMTDHLLQREILEEEDFRHYLAQVQALPELAT